MQHPESITHLGARYSKDDLKKLPRLHFVAHIDREFLAEEQGKGQWLFPPPIHITSESLRSAISEVTRFAEWLEKTGHSGDHG